MSIKSTGAGWNGLAWNAIQAVPLSCFFWSVPHSSFFTKLKPEAAGINVC